jgi:hypothetical protein
MALLVRRDELTNMLILLHVCCYRSEETREGHQEESHHSEAARA